VVKEQKEKDDLLKKESLHRKKEDKKPMTYSKEPPHKPEPKTDSSKS